MDKWEWKKKSQLHVTSLVKNWGNNINKNYKWFLGISLKNATCTHTNTKLDIYKQITDNFVKLYFNNIEKYIWPFVYANKIHTRPKL